MSVRITKISLVNSATPGPVTLIFPKCRLKQIVFSIAPYGAPVLAADTFTQWLGFSQTPEINGFSTSQTDSLLMLQVSGANWPQMNSIDLDVPIAAGSRLYHNFAVAGASTWQGTALLVYEY